MKSLSCPVCQNNKTRLKLTYQSQKLYLCPACSFEFIPHIKSTPSLYNQGYFEGHLSGAQGYKDYSSLNNHLIKEAQKKLEYIKKFTSAKKILDLGSGTGIFLKVAKSKGYNVTGNDISDYAIKHLKRSQIKTIPGSIEKNILPKETFDIITGWDVIEHLYNPSKAAKFINQSLKPGGYLFLTTPDTNRFDARLLGKNWYGYKKIPEHVGFFNTPSITRLLTDSKFKVTEIKPWGFYRDLDFIIEKLSNYSPFFNWIKRLVLITGTQKLSFFIPLTDSIIVAQKNET